ncbi:Molybdopterin biosynthesis family protein [Granulibacter bethesdensis]|uniref:Molybdopterin biosynthesis family protein n=1 Tax=Granulibacter bethesdensis TaxID=364410 RepID=A0AAC9P864_9PROT|nr:molybdopterin-binding/glycosyltransferase family 2 protein [Granulibacter bethesdensis]APH54182.1 Molybdopterin biosynthesis family protein [Granulibacter bethesdensis]APH61764.1 Molybdopterin biosynthesis family protein [Granulibacter bethesdensis]
MKFGRLPPLEATGAVLAHTHRLPDAVLRKGTVLTRDHIALLCRHGVSEIVCARLEVGDIPENEVACRLGVLLEGNGLKAGRAATGRVNLRATAYGLIDIEPTLINRLNRLHPGMTVATVPERHVLRPRDIAATIKIIPFAVPDVALRQAETLLQGRWPLQLHPFRMRRVGLILTTMPGTPETFYSLVETATVHRIESLGGCLLPPVHVPHEEAEIARAVGRLTDEEAVDVLLVAGASAVVDREDVVPAAVVLAGGEVVHFGMPVDPGNLLCLCRIGSMPVVVMPGCARKRDMNGVDHILHRIFAGLETGPEHIMAMGVGGLVGTASSIPDLDEVTPEEHHPMRMSSAVTPRIAVVILAAGLSRRMGSRHKLLQPGPDGRAMITHVIDQALQSRASEVVVVLGDHAEEMRSALATRDLTIVEAADYAQGLSASLRAGIAAIEESADAVLVCLGDMPFVSHGVMDRLMAAFDPVHAPIVAPVWEGQRGNPVLWSARFYRELRALSGDRGAASLLDRWQHRLCGVPMEDGACLIDIDTPDDLVNWTVSAAT